MGDKLNLKDCYNHLHDDLQQVDHYIQRITADAYRNVYLISNPVLSRNPHTNCLLHNFVFRIPARTINSFELAWKLSKFYLKSFLYLINHLITWIAVNIFFRFNWQRVSDPVIIDSFILVESTLSNTSYADKYFPGLVDILSKQGKNTYLFPCFDGKISLLRKGTQLFRIIRNSTVKIITEYDLLKIPDFFSLVRFILFYPFAVIRLSQQVDRSSYLGRLLSYELLGTLDQQIVFSHIRYLSGKRLASRFDGKIKVVSWFENQVQQKNLYRGLRDATQNSSIYACRAYIASPALLNLFVAEAEVSSGVVPDKVLVNGPAYVRHSNNLEYRLGVSFRYKYLFDTTIDPLAHKTQCLLFLSYFYERNMEFVNLCAASILSNQVVKVRTHPADTRSSRLILPAAWVHDTSDKGSLFNDVAIIITSESGIAVEAAASGVSVIVVANQSSFTCNPMFDYGRGIIWDIVFDCIELDKVYKQLMVQRSTNIEEIKRAAQWYKSSCFVEPTENNIVRAFDLA